MMVAPLLNAAAQEGPPGCAAIAGGSRGTVRAGAAVLAAGGNAVDAALAAMLATPLGEPAMTSMGGGGFLLVRTPEGDSTVVDFFVDTPGLGSSPRRPASFVPVLVTYPGTVQTFHIGAGAAAVPGCIPGFLDAHRAFGRLPLAEVLAPAMAMAFEGWPWEFMQVRLLDLVRDIFNSAETGRALINRADGQPVQVGDIARLPHYGQLLAKIAEGTVTGLASPAFADPMLAYMKSAGGLITGDDLAQYRVYHRAPITLHRHGADIMTNPAPSFGGPIIIDALARTERMDDSPGHWCAAAHNLDRSTEFRRQSSMGAAVHSTQGTTHISVIDADGMVAALSTSNGAGSGAWVPDLGLHLNNMLGEEDLNPAGFHAIPPGLRIGSMMAPTVVRREDGSLLALGTGGSERIRSAIYQVLLRTVDLGTSAAEAIVAPRFHPKGKTLQLEPGWPTEVLESFNLENEINVWARHETYFGGVHAVMRNADGSVQAVGDPRRHGTTSVVTPDGEVLVPPLP